MRKAGTDSRGEAWTAEAIRDVWNRGMPEPGWDPAEFRRDCCGAWINFAKYGETVPGGCGWEVDHIFPIAAGGTDDLSNLQPMQWQNNRSKGDDWPSWRCAIPERG